MSFDQHSSFVKEGIKLYEEQIKKLEEIKKEEREKRLNNINIGNKKNIINNNSIKNKEIRKKLIFKKERMLGKKRNIISNTKKNYSINDLIYSVDDFIYNKRDFKYNDYESFFNDIQLKISQNKLNTNGFHVSQKYLFNKYYIINIFILIQAVLKLQKYLNNPRNFQNQITNKKIFIDLNKFLNTKIIETLFDSNLISNSIINQEINKIQLDEEEQEICDIINKIKNGEDEDIIIIEEEYNDDINKEINDENEEKRCDNYNLSNTNNSSRSSTEKKILYSEEEKSITYIDKLIKKVEDKNKFIIIPMNNNSLYDLLNYISFNDNNPILRKLNNYNNNKNIRITNQQIIEKVGDINRNIINNELIVKNSYLRKDACLKLYKAFCIIFKDYDIQKNHIKDLCKIIEYNARNQDLDMKSKYKQYIWHILKKMSL